MEAEAGGLLECCRVLGLVVRWLVCSGKARQWMGCSLSGRWCSGGRRRERKGAAVVANARRFLGDAREARQGSEEARKVEVCFVVAGCWSSGKMAECESPSLKGEREWFCSIEAYTKEAMQEVACTGARCRVAGHGRRVRALQRAPEGARTMHGGLQVAGHSAREQQTCADDWGQIL